MAHFFDPHNEAKDLARCDFSKEIAKIVKDILKNGDFSEIILIASPKVLNLMRKYMQKIVNIEIKEIVKDLVHSSEEQIAKVAFS